MFWNTFTDNNKLVQLASILCGAIIQSFRGIAGPTSCMYSSYEDFKAELVKIASAVDLDGENDEMVLKQMALSAS